MTIARDDVLTGVTGYSNVQLADKWPKVPEWVQVGPYRYRITATTEAINALRATATDHRDDSTRVGYSDHVKLVITLDPQLPLDLLAETMLHEMMHCCYTAAGRSGETLAEEAVIDTLSPVLLDTLRRNPDVASFLLGWRG